MSASQLLRVWEETEMAQRDITKTNLAIEKLLAVTDNPDTDFFSRPFTVTASLRLRGVTRRFSLLT
jgi:hypothetical protein